MSADMAFVVANSKIKVENFRALFWASSLNRFFQRTFPFLRLRILSDFQCRVRYAKFAMLQTSEPNAIKGAILNFLCLRFANWTRHHRQFPDVAPHIIYACISFADQQIGSALVTPAAGRKEEDNAPSSDEFFRTE